MKKKVFREKYSVANMLTGERAMKLIDKDIEIIDNEKKITKRGRKNVKSSK